MSRVMKDQFYNIEKMSQSMFDRCDPANAYTSHIISWGPNRAHMCLQDLQTVIEFGQVSGTGELEDPYLGG